ncbi:MAG: SH3 domain-containing protein, partial [Opitutae bacterium]|nr:SH3 domain-containing protein [Opitutae bacterium]
MKTFHAFLSGAALLAAAVPLHAQTPVRVLADHVNLRAKPVLTAEVVAQANYDDRLVAREMGEEWIEVAAPPSVDLWVMKQYVQTPQNTIGAPRVNLRAGPSINYNIVDTLALGDKVEPRGEEVQDWLKIAPPASAHVWVHRDYVEVISGTPLPPKIDGKSAAKSGKTAEISAKTAHHASEDASGDEKSSKKRKTKKKDGEPALAAASAAAAEAALPTPIVSP